MEVDRLLRSRIQFAVNISFQFLLPTLSIGLGYFLLFSAFVSPSPAIVPGSLSMPFGSSY
jgi:hypothetical protein